MNRRLTLLAALALAATAHAQQPPPLSPLYDQASVKLWPPEPTLVNACEQFAADPKFGGRDPIICEYYAQWMKAPRSNQTNSPGYREYALSPKPSGLSRDVATLFVMDGSLVFCAMHTGIGTVRAGMIAGLCWRLVKQDMMSCDLTDADATVLGCVPTERPEVQP